MPGRQQSRDAWRDDARWLRLLADRVRDTEGEALSRLLGRDWADRAINLAFDVVRMGGHWWRRVSERLLPPHP